jgi:hypothetical protein
MWEQSFAYGVVAIGTEGEDVLVRDRTAWARRVPRATFAHARATIPANKNRLLDFSVPAAPPDLAAAVRSGIRQCAAEMIRPPIKDFGLAAWEKWSAALVHPADEKAWPIRMAAPCALAQALTSAYRAMLTECGPRALRDAYARFLAEAAPVLRLPALEDVAARYAALGEQWRAFSQALLPDAIPALAAARRRIDARESALHDPAAGPPDRVGRTPPGFDESSFSAVERADLLAGLSARLSALHLGESDAIGALRAAAG